MHLNHKPSFWDHFLWKWLIIGWYDVTWEGFHVTSYQANFASHHTRDRHVGFPFACEGIGKSNKIFHNFLFSSYHITKLEPRGKNIITHTWWKLQLFPWSKLKVPSVFCCFSPYRAVKKETNHKCIPRCTNPL